MSTGCDQVRKLVSFLRKTLIGKKKIDFFVEFGCSRNLAGGDEAEFNWTTIEVQHDFGKAFPELEAAYLKSKEKPVKAKKKTKTSAAEPSTSRSKLPLVLLYFRLYLWFQ